MEDSRCGQFFKLLNHLCKLPIANKFPLGNNSVEYFVKAPKNLIFVLNNVLCFTMYGQHLARDPKTIMTSAFYFVKRIWLLFKKNCSGNVVLLN